jgi:hypothetical protein
MFAVTEEQAATIRTVFEQRGELSATVELRRMFPGIRDVQQARECVRIIAGWKPLPAQARPRGLISDLPGRSCGFGDLHLEVPQHARLCDR